MLAAIFLMLTGIFGVLLSLFCAFCADKLESRRQVLRPDDED